VNSGLYATVAIGVEEARNGTQRTLTLPDGKHVTIVIPPGVPEGYLLYLDGQGNTYTRHDQVGTPLLTVVVHIDAGARPNINSEPDQATVRGVFYAPPGPATTDNVPPALEPTRLPSPYGGPSYSEPGYGNITPPPPPSYPQPLPSYPQPLPPYPQPSSLPLAPKRSGKLVLGLVAVGLVVVMIISFGAYQNHVKQVGVAATATAQANSTATTTAQVHDTAVAIAAATASVIAANPYPSYLPGSGKLVLHDPLTQSGAWTEASDASFGGSCQFAGGAFQVSEVKANHYYECTTNSLKFSDFAFQVQMTLQQGDCGGMTFRDNHAGKDYRFLICRDGTYGLGLDRDLTGNNNSTLGQGSLNNTSVLNRSVSLAIIAKGASIGIYCNGQQVINVTDSSYTSGELGLLATNLGSNTTVAYSNARVWTF
jgi:hypothetical protein